MWNRRLSRSSNQSISQISQKTISFTSKYVTTTSTYKHILGSQQDDPEQYADEDADNYAGYE
jgi:hypothetical protein